MSKEKNKLGLNALKKRVLAAKPKPASPASEAAAIVNFHRIHLKSYRQVRGTCAKILKAVLLSQITPDVARASVALLDRALAVNHALLLQDRLASVSQFLQMGDIPEPDAGETDIPDEEPEEPNAPEEEE
jgi:hypothetical protein